MFKFLSTGWFLDRTTAVATKYQYGSIYLKVSVFVDRTNVSHMSPKKHSNNLLIMFCNFYIPTQMLTFYSHPFPTLFIALNEIASNLESIHEKQ